MLRQLPSKPNPGSPEALTKGCRCPVIDNAHGEGTGWGGAAAFWINIRCPLHGEKEKQDGR
jgi:hypothetical protein